jgi:hypothetical protein
MSKLFSLAAGAALILGATTGLSAQQTRTGSATITIPEVMVFEATNTAVTFNAPTASDFDAQLIAANASTVLSHRANVRHSVTIHADQAAFNASNPTPATGGGTINAARIKPAGDLSWSTNGTSFTALTTTPTKVVTQTAASGTLNTATVDYQLALSWSQDTPGQYVLPFRYVMFAD